MLNKDNLLKLARMKNAIRQVCRQSADLIFPKNICFGLPVKGHFRRGTLGELMQLCLALKVEGLDSVGQTSALGRQRKQ